MQCDYKEQGADGNLKGAITTKYNLKTQSSS
jgi:hypothetical protein